jgi:hypothetical protein
LDDVKMAVGDRVEGAWIDCCAHGYLASKK